MALRKIRWQQFLMANLERNVPVFSNDAQRDAVYQRMEERIACGPFDGGCVAFAMALQHIHGGELMVVEGRSLSRLDTFRQPVYRGDLMAQHAIVVFPDGTAMDADGRCSVKLMLRRTARWTHPIASVEGIRALQDGDLEDAPRDAALVHELVDLLRPAPSFDSPTP